MSSRKLLRRFSSSLSDLLSLQRNNDESVSARRLTALHEAVIAGNIEMTKQLLAASACWVDEEDGRGRTALHYAVEKSFLAGVQLLLEKGANPDCVDFYGLSACHLAAREGLIDVFDILVYYKCDMCAIDRQGKTPFDWACELGKEKMVEKFLQSGISLSSLLKAGSAHTASAIHLAAKNDHVHIVHLLLTNSWPLNATTKKGTSLHEAVWHGSVQTVRFLLRNGIDDSIEDKNGQRCIDCYKKNRHLHPSVVRECKYLLKSHKTFCHGKAIADYSGCLSDELNFSKDSYIWVTNRVGTKRWQGIIFGKGGFSQIGYFLPQCIQLVENSPLLISMSGRVAGTALHSSASTRTAKKVATPTVPEGSNFESGEHIALQTFSSKASSHSSLTSPHYPMDSSLGSRSLNRKQQTCNILRMGTMSDQRYKSSPGIVMPLTCTANSDTTHRESGGSNSSQGSSGFDSMKSSVLASSSSSSFPNSHTMSSNLDSPQSRTSVHSGGSGCSGSLASCSADTLDDGYGTYGENTVNVSNLATKGVPEAEILAMWLNQLRLSEYLSLFLMQGYDLPSISRITPEDLNSLGVTSPSHRKRMITEIHSWQITDRWPCVPPAGGLKEWLHVIGLPEYYQLFVSQGYESIQEVMKLTWEDFEDIGIKRLGHLKRLGLAIKKLKDFRRPTVQSVDSFGYSTSTLTRPHDPPPPAPSSYCQNKVPTSNSNSSIDYISYARGIKSPPPPPIRGQALKNHDPDSYDHLLSTREPIRLKLHQPGRILSETSAGIEPDFFTSLPPGADCPPPPAPLVCERSIRRLQSAVTNTKPNGFVAEQIPFANENCGTIKQKTNITPIPASKLYPTQHSDQTNTKQNVQATNNNSVVLNDIGHMLQNLTDELDALLVPEKKAPLV